MEKENKSSSSRKSESERYKEVVQELEEQGYQVHEPKIIFDGKCKHSYSDLGINKYGKGEAKCQLCPMGTYYDPDKEEIENGRITTK